MKKYFYICISFFLTLVHVFSESPFEVIMYDVKTENALGVFPPNRTVWAKTIDKVKELGAQAVVLKFFFDLPKEEDRYLSQSMSNSPIFLQACLNNTEGSSADLNTKFYFTLDKKYDKVISGEKGWIPVKVLMDNAYDVGFVDIRDFNEIPLIENYK